MCALCLSITLLLVVKAGVAADYDGSIDNKSH